MLKIALCDDCSEDVALLHSALDSYLSRCHKGPIQVYPFDNALLCAEGLAQIGSVDVLLLDICMPGLLGTDIAREVRQRKDKTEIVFLTGSDEFAVEAFTLKAAHYLVKPFSQDEFDEALETALSRIASKEAKRITLKARGRSIVSLDTEEITYIESSSHSQHLHTSKGECIEARQTLGEVRSLLENATPGQFFSPYKGYIVNINTVRTIENSQVVLRDGTTIPATPANAKALKECYFDRIFPSGGAPWKP